jgi:hypothetical protein
MPRRLVSQKAGTSRGRRHARIGGDDACYVEIGETVGVVRPSTKLWTFAEVVHPLPQYPNSIFVDFKSTSGMALEVPSGSTILTFMPGKMPSTDLRGAKIQDGRDLKRCTLVKIAPKAGGYVKQAKLARDSKGRFVSKGFMF